MADKLNHLALAHLVPSYLLSVIEKYYKENIENNKVAKQ